MGTNYYAKVKCKHCGRNDDIHLGKSSAGWQFSFQYNGGQFYKNIAEMKEWLKDKEIEDEYGKIITHAEFWEAIEDKKRKKMLSQADYVKEHHPEIVDTFKIDGYSFTDTNFS